MTKYEVRLKKEKTELMKEISGMGTIHADVLHRRDKLEAINTVLAVIDTRKHVKGFKNDDSTILAIIKKERDIYLESQSGDQKVLEGYKVKADFLTSYLPEMLSEEETEDMIRYFIKHKDASNPKEVMSHFEDGGLTGRYDRGFVAKTTIAIIKGEQG